MTMSTRNLTNKYHIWDSRNIGALLPDEEFIDVTVTSPPYWNLKDYGSHSQIGFGQSYDAYLSDLEEVFRSIYSRTKKKGSLWIVSDTFRHDGEIKLIPFDLAQRLRKIGWILQDIIIWEKDRTLPWSHQGKLRNIFEYVACYSKDAKFKYHLDRVREITELREWWVRYPERYSPQGKAPTRTWLIPIPRQGSWGKNWVRHFNPLPPALVERILLLTTDERDVVLDPFAGSGAVLAQARVMGRRYVGLDLSRSYRKMFEKQVLPAIKEHRRQSRSGSRETESRKRQFGKLIRALRKVKYPKELVRLYIGKYGSTRCAAVLALQGARSNALNVFFLFPPGRRPPRGFMKRVKILAQHPPLSKYGITATIQTLSTASVSRDWWEKHGVAANKRLYVYTQGRTYAWSKKTERDDLIGPMIGTSAPLQGASPRHPPIISDIRCNVERGAHPFESEDEE